MSENKVATPLLDELEKGAWPSFVKEIKKEAHRPLVQDLLGVLHRSYEERVGHWKHGGLVGVMGYGGGVIGRYCDLQEEFPEVAEFHTMRINQPAAWFYTSDALRKLCDIWDKHGSGLTNMHGSTGDIIFLGCKTEELEPTFADLTEAGFDLGGSGSAMRTPSCCVGPARCEWACFDTLNACYDITQSFQDEMHRPMFPYKYKFKFAGCPNDCVASIARAEMSTTSRAIRKKSRPTPRTVPTSRTRSASSARRTASSGTARSSTSITPSASSACTASTCCRRPSSRARNAARPSSSAPRPRSSAALCSPRSSYRSSR